MGRLVCLPNLPGGRKRRWVGPPSLDKTRTGVHANPRFAVRLFGDSSSEIPCSRDPDVRHPNVNFPGAVRSGRSTWKSQG